MIKSVKCNQPSFKAIEFDKGLNLIIADCHEESSDKDSRNGAGKSSLIEIIDFCMGASAKDGEGLLRAELADWIFSLELVFNDKEYIVHRNTSEPSKVYVEGDFADWIVQPLYSKKTDSYYLKIKDWNTVLGQLIFNLDPEETSKTYAPSYRSLIPYFIRSGNDAFIDPFTYFKNEKVWQIQVYNAFLLNLNWEYAIEFQRLKDEKKVLDELKKASKQGLLKGFMGSVGEMEAEKVALSAKIEKMEEQLSSFKVHPQYYDIQKNADKLTKKIHTITDELFLNQELLSRYQNNKFEEDVDIEKVEKIYKNAGLIFKDDLKKDLNEVIEFHKKLVENRGSYLEAEIKRLSKEIETQKNEIENLSNERAQNLEVLKTHNALEEQTKLQDRATKEKQRLYEINSYIANLKKIEKSSSQIKIKTEELIQKALTDLDERKVQKEKAIKIFNEIADYLYSEPGILSINIENSGYKYDTYIGKDKSSGRNSMKIFDYDFTVMQIRAGINGMPNLLIHDGDIFDPVDERQIALALEYASAKTTEINGQYICALNSDRIPYNSFSDEFKNKFNEFIKLKLDDSESGGLFGFRFN